MLRSVCSYSCNSFGETRERRERERGGSGGEERTGKEDTVSMAGERAKTRRSCSSSGGGRGKWVSSCPWATWPAINDEVRKQPSRPAGLHGGGMAEKTVYARDWAMGIMTNERSERASELDSIN